MPCTYQPLVVVAGRRRDWVRGVPGSSSRPFELKGVTLRNRVVSTSHEPAYAEEGMPKDRYRLYHLEKARGGVGLTMIGGSAVVSPDSPPAFGNLLLYQDEIVPWLRRLTDDVHDRRRSGHVPGHAPRSPHQQLHRRLAPRGLCLAVARAGPPQLPEGRGALGPRPHRRRLRLRSRALRRGGPRRHRAASPTDTSSTASSPRPPTCAATTSAGASNTACRSRAG